MAALRGRRVPQLGHRQAARVMTTLTEKLWQRTVVDLLQFHGYLTNHIFASQLRDGRFTTTTTCKGWPDLTAVGRGHLLAIECKGPKTPVTPEQLDVLAALAAVPCVRAWLLRPLLGQDWDCLVGWVARPGTAPVRWGW